MSKVASPLSGGNQSQQRTETYTQSLVTLGLYVVSAIVASWPLAGSVGSAISYGGEGEATVPLLNLWTLWWNSDRAWAGFRGYWDAPIFAPHQGTFAFSESQPTMVIVAPVVWLTGNRVLAYNLYQLGVLALNGWAGQNLLRRVGYGPWLSFCGGAMCQLMPFVWWQFGVVQLTTLFGICWTVHSLLDVVDARFDSRPKTDSDVGVTTDDGPAPSVSSAAAQTRVTGAATWSHFFPGLRLGASFGLTYWLCNYWGLYLTVLLAPAGLWFLGRRWWTRSFLAQMAVASCVAAMMVLPIARVQRQLATRHEWTREQNTIINLSAHVRDLTDVPGAALLSRFETPEPSRSNVWPLGGGLLKLWLAPIGLISLLLRPGRRRWGLFVLTFGLLALAFSLGPAMDWRGFSPYRCLQDYVPGFKLIRSPFRFVLFVHLATIWLAVDFLSLLDWRVWRKASASVTDTKESASQVGVKDAAIPFNAKLSFKLWGFTDWKKLFRWRSLLAIPLVAMSLLATLEVLPYRQQLYQCRASDRLPVWVLWLRDSTSPHETVVCLPFPVGYHVRGYESTSVWMYWATFHGRRLINGYSGFFPKDFVALKNDLQSFQLDPGTTAETTGPPRLNQYPLDAPGLMKLNTCGATYVVVPRAFATADDVFHHPVTRYRWALVAADEAEQTDVYLIQPPLE